MGLIILEYEPRTRGRGATTRGEPYQVRRVFAGEVGFLLTGGQDTDPVGAQASACALFVVAELTIGVPVPESSSAT